jgi:hypothetical protein
MVPEPARMSAMAKGKPLRDAIAATEVVHRAAQTTST